MSSEGQYDLNEKIIRFFKHLGGKTVITIGGYNTSNSYIQNPRVFGVATKKQIMHDMEKNGVIFGKAVGTIFGSAGMLVYFAKKHKLEGTCLMWETGLLEVDANSAKAFLNVLKNLLKTNINLENIDMIK